MDIEQIAAELFVKMLKFQDVKIEQHGNPVGWFTWGSDIYNVYKEYLNFHYNLSHEDRTIEKREEVERKIRHLHNHLTLIEKQPDFVKEINKDVLESSS